MAATVPGVVFSPVYSQLELPDRHRFPIQKYQALYDALCHRGVTPERFHSPEPVQPALLEQYFQPEYVRAFLHDGLDKAAMRRIGFPWSEQLVRRTLTAVGGSLLTAELAMQHGTALNLTGGYHHGFADFGSGFCIFNDLWLMANLLLQRPGIDRVLIVDCDVHQGDGTALLAQECNDIFTLSLHCEKNFPYRKQNSDLDFGLPREIDDVSYLDALDQALSLAFRLFQPDAVIFDAGVDVHINDDLGHFHLTTEGVYLRDSMVFEYCRQHCLPVACVIGGGYQRDIDALTHVHLQLFRAAGVIT